MTEDKTKTFALLIAAIGVLLIGISGMIFSLRCPYSVKWYRTPASSTFGKCVPAPPFSSSRSYTNRLSASSVSNVLAVFKGMSLFVDTNDARTVAQAFAEDSRIKGLGIDPEVLSNAFLDAFSHSNVQQHIRMPLDENSLRKLFESTPVRVNERTQIITSRP